MKSMQIKIAEDDEDQKEQRLNSLDFYCELKDSLSELDHLELDEVRELVQSDDFKEDRERVETQFWKQFKKITKEDCSLDCAILLGYYGFSLTKKDDDKITMIEEISNLDIY